MKKKGPFFELAKGIVKENPVLVLVLGMCPTLAVTTSAKNGIAMGIAATAVLIGSNSVISLIRKFVPDEVRIPIFIVVIASFVTVIQLVMNAYFYELFKVLGLFIPLIVVNCIILGRAEAFASKNNVFLSILDGIGMGIGFTLTLFFLGAFREILGSGTVLGFNILGESYSKNPMLIMILPPGGFLMLGLMMAFVKVFTEKRK
ncbi:electron transport complex subunit E [candidate division WOR-3 bacterium]|nr:electron transport complex subunit E [candidate division WOR-3 bacterium]